MPSVLIHVWIASVTDISLPVVFPCHWFLMIQFSNQLDAMQHLKEQLEQRTRMIEANIQRQQDELLQIQGELQRVQGQSLQVSCFGVRGFIHVLFTVFIGFISFTVGWIFCCRNLNQSCMLQMFLQKGTGGLNVNSVQMAQGNAVQQGGALSIQGQVVSTGPLQNSIPQQHAVQPQSQQQTLLREQSTALSQVRQAESEFPLAVRNI